MPFEVIFAPLRIESLFVFSFADGALPRGSMISDFLSETHLRACLFPLAHFFSPVFFDGFRSALAGMISRGWILPRALFADFARLACLPYTSAPYVAAGGAAIHHGFIALMAASMLLIHTSNHHMNF